MTNELTDEQKAEIQHLSDPLALMAVEMQESAIGIAAIRDAVTGVSKTLALAITQVTMLGAAADLAIQAIDRGDAAEARRLLEKVKNGAAGAFVTSKEERPHAA